MKLISLALCMVAIALAGGCNHNYQLADGSGGKLSYTPLFAPDVRLNITNNTNLLVDLEINGSPVKKDLATGETFPWPLYEYQDRVTVVAKFHTKDGHYLGMDAWEISVRSSKRGTRNEALIIDRFEPVSVLDPG